MGHPALDGNVTPLPVHFDAFPVHVSHFWRTVYPNNPLRPILNFNYFQLPVLSSYFRSIHDIFSGIGLFESDKALHNSYWMLLVLY